MKRCGTCKESKPFSEFHRRSRGGFQNDCKRCRKSIDAAWYLKSKTKVRARARNLEISATLRLLKDAPCVDCGGEFHYAAMTWDHLPGSEKLFDIGSVIGRSYSLKRVLAEIEKCELVCANCHAVRTHERLPG